MKRPSHSRPTLSANFNDVFIENLVGVSASEHNVKLLFATSNLPLDEGTSFALRLTLPRSSFSELVSKLLDAQREMAQSEAAARKQAKGT